MVLDDPLGSHRRGQGCPISTSFDFYKDLAYIRAKRVEVGSAGKPSGGSKTLPPSGSQKRT